MVDVHALREAVRRFAWKTSIADQSRPVTGADLQKQRDEIVKVLNRFIEVLSQED